MDWRLLRGRWRLWRNRCPACNSNGNPCGLPNGKRVVWERFKRELNIQYLFAKIQEGFEREEKRRQNKHC